MPTRTTTTQLTLTEYAVLGLLIHMGREISGYELKKVADESVGYIWGPSKSQLYVVLRRLVDDGLARRRAVVQHDRPDKQLYLPTVAGRAAVKDWLDRDEGETDPDQSTFLLKLFFGAQADRDALVRQLESFRSSYAERLAVYERKARLGPADGYTRMTLLYGIERARAAVRWADATLEELRA